MREDVKMADRLTREQAAIISAYTGVLVGPFTDFHEYAERLMGRPVWTREMASKEFMAKLCELAIPDFLAIAAETPSESK
jgi:hypothetical protein